MCACSHHVASACTRKIVAALQDLSALLKISLPHPAPSWDALSSPPLPLLQSHICCPCAVGGNREYVQKRVGGHRVLNDPCDNRIMRCNNCVDTMLCKCNWWLCCPLTEEHGEQQRMAINRENRKLNVFGLMAYLPVLSCLQVQTLLQFTRGSKEPPVNKLAELPRWWGDRLAGEIHPDDDGGLKLWLSAHDPRSKDLHIDGRKKRGYKRTIKGQPRRSNRVHPLHPLHPLSPHIKELRTKDVPDPTREPDADTEEVHALWATSHVNRSAWKRSGWVDNSGQLHRPVAARSRFASPRGACATGRLPFFAQFSRGISLHHRNAGYIPDHPAKATATRIAGVGHAGPARQWTRAPAGRRVLPVSEGRHFLGPGWPLRQRWQQFCGRGT